MCAICVCAFTLARSRHHIVRPQFAAGQCTFAAAAAATTVRIFMPGVVVPSRARHVCSLQRSSAATQRSSSSSSSSSSFCGDVCVPSFLFLVCCLACFACAVRAEASAGLSVIGRSDVLVAVVAVGILDSCLTFRAQPFQCLVAEACRCFLQGHVNFLPPFFAMFVFWSFCLCKVNVIAEFVFCSHFIPF